MIHQSTRRHSMLKGIQRSAQHAETHGRGKFPVGELVHFHHHQHHTPIHSYRHCAALRCAALPCPALPCPALRCAALRCVALRCAALRCAALRLAPYKSPRVIPSTRHNCQSAAREPASLPGNQPCQARPASLWRLRQNRARCLAAWQNDSIVHQSVVHLRHASGYRTRDTNRGN